MRAYSLEDRRTIIESWIGPLADEDCPEILEEFKGDVFEESARRVKEVLDFDG